LKRISFSEEAQADIRSIPQHIAMSILSAIHRLAENGSGDVRMLRDSDGEKRLRVGDYRIRFSEEPENTLRIHTVRNRKDAYR
jgi:mRNA interferase RelE/StbE